jgi:hypothetical protein
MEAEILIGILAGVLMANASYRSSENSEPRQFPNCKVDLPQTVGHRLEGHPGDTPLVQGFYRASICPHDLSRMLVGQ